jgi:hypothetical protein
VLLLEWTEQQREVLLCRDRLERRALDGGEGRRNRLIKSAETCAPPRRSAHGGGYRCLPTTGPLARPRGCHGTRAGRGSIAHALDASDPWHQAAAATGCRQPSCAGHGCGRPDGDAGSAQPQWNAEQCKDCPDRDVIHRLRNADGRCCLRPSCIQPHRCPAGPPHPDEVKQERDRGPIATDSANSRSTQVVVGRSCHARSWSSHPELRPFDGEQAAELVRLSDTGRSHVLLLILQKAADGSVDAHEIDESDGRGRAPGARKVPWPSGVIDAPAARTAAIVGTTAVVARCRPTS